MNTSQAEVPLITKWIAVVVVVAGLVLLGLALCAGITVGLILSGS